MNILLLFATYSGSTEAASQIVLTNLKNKGHHVDVKTPTQINPKDFNNFDLMIFCTPTWDYNGMEGQPHEDFVHFMEQSNDGISENKKFAIMGLGDSSYHKFCGSVDVLEEYVKKIKGNLIVPSLRIDGFFYDQTKNENLIQTWSEKLA